MQELRTKRLLLRRFREDDYDDLFEFLSQLKDDEFEGYPGINYENGREHLKYRLGSEEFYAIELTGFGKVIGNIYCGIRDDATKEVGYIVNRRYRQRGYAAEALSAVIGQAFAEGAHRIYAECDPRNVPSWKLLEKVGMRREAHFKQNTWFHRDANGAPIWKDTLVYATLESDGGAWIVGGKTYRILKLLGHGKGGYSWLADCGGQRVVVKQIHHEPCDYYAFGNKIEAERRDYERLQAAGIRVPEMLAIDLDTERIVKAYIEGPTIFDLIKGGASAEPYLAQARDMAARAKAAGLNMDWFPTNFVVRDGLIWYVDYECNEYMDEWSFDIWGIRYWSRTPELEAYLKEHPPTYTIRQERVAAQEYIEFLKRTDLGSQYPQERFEERIGRLVNAVSISLTARNEQGLLVGALFGLTDYAYWLYITDLGVDRDCTHQGIGRRLMQTAHQVAGGEKDIAVYLIANEKAVPFYQRCGMKKTDDVMRCNRIE